MREHGFLARLLRRARVGIAVAAALLIFAAAPVLAQPEGAAPPAAGTEGRPAPPAPQVEPEPQPTGSGQANPHANSQPTPAPQPRLQQASPATSTLPHDLSPWGMFLSADLVVKAVMVGLALASVVTWTVWLAKSLELFAATRRLRAALAAIDGARSLGEAARQIGEGGRARSEARALLRAALDEFDLSAGLPGEGVRERIASRFERLQAAFSRRMAAGTGILATIGSTAPFVGLFGTVWGIMNSFVGISRAQTTNLAVVAPGIAEALLATAIGLVAAIPAVVIYNLFARSITGYRARLADTSAAIMRLVSRDLDGAHRHLRAAE